MIETMKKFSEIRAAPSSKIIIDYLILISSFVLLHHYLAYSQRCYIRNESALHLITYSSHLLIVVRVAGYSRD